ncbi:TPA: PAS domain S-box protein [Candidatus Poribacteria bacterium]|nr:PAS domain S-box protein [Candidatus Poribacteria bacterium]
MKDEDKTKEQLIIDLSEMRQRIAELETLEKKRKTVEEELRQSENQYRTIFENTGTAIGILEEDTTISLVNTEFERLFGYSKEECEGKKSWTELIVEEDLGKMKEYHYLRAPSRNYECRFIDKKGNVRDGFLTVAMIPGTKRSVASLLDITKLKQTENALRQERDRAQKYLDIAGVMFVAINAKEEVTLINQKGCEILEYEQEEIIGKNWFDNFLPERIRDEVKSVFQKLMTGEIELVEYFENPVLTKNGEERIIAWHNTALKDETDNIIGTLSSGEDITERRRTEESLRESEEKYRELVEDINDVIYSTDENGVITYVSPAIEAISGYSPSEVIGRNFAEFIHKEDLPYIMQMFQNAIAGDLQPDEYRIMTKSDAVRWVRTYSRPFFVKGKPAGLRGVLTDITEQRQAEAKIRASLKEKEAFLKEIHHRVKNNMQIISSLLSLQRREISDEKLSAMFKDSQNRIRSMALIHEKLYQSENLANIDFTDYIEDLAHSLFHAYAGRGKIALKIDVEDISLSIDSAIPCGLILNELVSNSLQHAFPGEQKGEIKIVLRSIENDIELIVSDNGIGMPDNLDFRNTESLGLQLATTLAENQLQGKIELDRTEGTEFRITFKIPE